MDRVYKVFTISGGSLGTCMVEGHPSEFAEEYVTKELAELAIADYLKRTGGRGRFRNLIILECFAPNSDYSNDVIEDLEWREGKQRNVV